MQNGVSGHCQVISRSSGAAIPPGLIRVHLCKHNPCQARWEHGCKYGDVGFPMHVQLAEDWRPLASPEPPAPVPPPAAVHSHPVEAPLGPGEGDDGVPEADAAFYFWCPEETPQDTAVAAATDTAVADAAWIQSGIEEVHSHHIAECLSLIHI